MRGLSMHDFILLTQPTSKRGLKSTALALQARAVLMLQKFFTRTLRFFSIVLKYV